MDWANNTIEVLYFLVPGFIAAAVYYGLTSAAKPNTFERLIQALIFTIIVQALTKLGSLTGWLEDETWEAVAPSGTVVVAVVIGLLAGAACQQGCSTPLAPAVANHEGNCLPNRLVRRVRQEPRLLRGPAPAERTTALRMAKPVARGRERAAVRDRRATVADGG